MSAAVQPNPFPALTPAQRLHIEIYGYVIIENVLSEEEVNGLKDALYGIEDDFRRTGELPGPNCFHTSTREDFFRIDNLPHLDPRFFDYVTNPFILGMAEEIVGGPVRLQQSDAHIRRPLAEDERRYGFHRGINPAYSHYEQGALSLLLYQGTDEFDGLGAGRWGHDGDCRNAQGAAGCAAGGDRRGGAGGYVDDPPG